MSLANRSARKLPHWSCVQPERGACDLSGWPFIQLAYTVPEEGVARVSGVPSEDVALGDFADEPLAVGEYCTLEVEV